MGIKNLPITDIYYTPSNDVLLRGSHGLFRLEDVINPESLSLQNLLNESAKNGAAQPQQSSQQNDPYRKMRNDIFKDCTQIHHLASSNEDVDSSFIYEGYSYRVNRTVAVGGYAYSLRRLPLDIPKLEELGYDAHLIPHLMNLAKGHGLILLSGATGSGKTTTISSILSRFITECGEFAYTIEDPPEYQLHGAYHYGDKHGYCMQTKPPKGAWGAGLRSALRSRPRYIFVGEVRDSECASELLRAANSGHLIFSSIHAQSVQDSIAALVKYASAALSEDLARDLLAQGLLCAIHQSIEFGKLQYQALFCGPPSTPVRNKIAEGKLVSLLNDIERQRIRMEKRQPFFE